VRKGGLEPEAETEKLRFFAGRCCAVWRRSAPFGPQGAILPSSSSRRRPASRRSSCSGSRGPVGGTGDGLRTVRPGLTCRRPSSSTSSER